MATSIPTGNHERLDSWKEIATYLNRGVRTVQRWERDAGLPVHRLPTEKRGVVHAYRAEIDLWWRTKSGLDDVEQPVAAQPVASRSHLHWLVLAAVLIAGVATAAVVLLHSQKHLRLEAARRITWEGNILTPAISPDWKYMAFASTRLNRDGNLDLWIGSANGTDFRRLTTTTEHEFDPVFAADSSRILYSVSEQRPADMLEVAGPPAPRTTSLYESDLSGRAKLIAENAGSGRYSPDGRWIALLRAVPHGDRYEFGVMPAAGGEFVAIAIRNSDVDRLESCSPPVWSPDGRQILVSVRTSKALRYEWWLIDVVSRTARPTRAVGEMMSAGYPQPALPGIAPQAWLRDGIVLTKGFGSGAIGIWAVKFDPKFERLREKPFKLLAPPTEVRWFSVAGDRVLFNGGDSTGAVDVIPFDLDSAHPLTHITSFRKSNPGGYAYLSLSRDGRTLSFASRQSSGAAPQVFTADLDSGMETRIPAPPTSSVGAMQYTAMRPDGKLIAYGAVSPKGRPLYIWNSVQGTNDLVLPDCGCRPLSWTPDGRALLVYLPDIHPRPIGFFDPRTRTSAKILQSATDDLIAAQVSPDSTQIAFLNSRGMLFTAPFRGPRSTAITEWRQVPEAGRVIASFWSPNGQRIYFAVPDRDGTRILSEQIGRGGQPLDGPKEVYRTSWTSSFDYSFGSAIVGNGKRIVGTTTAATTDLWTATLQ